MEKKDRKKYYPVFLKDKKLHDNFVIEQKIKGFKNADQMVQYLLELEEKNKFLEKRCTQKENDFNELLKIRTFTQEEITALLDHTRDIDLCDTEEERYKDIIKSAHMKLKRMKGGE